MNVRVCIAVITAESQATRITPVTEEDAPSKIENDSRRGRWRTRMAAMRSKDQVARTRCGARVRTVAGARRLSDRYLLTALGG